jgi:hypothetical protein
VDKPVAEASEVGAQMIWIMESERGRDAGARLANNPLRTATSIRGMPILSLRWVVSAAESYGQDATVETSAGLVESTWTNYSGATTGQGIQR